MQMWGITLKIEKLSHIIGARGSQDLRSPFPIMAPAYNTWENLLQYFTLRYLCRDYKDSDLVQ